MRPRAVVCVIAVAGPSLLVGCPQLEQDFVIAADGATGGQGDAGSNVDGSDAEANEGPDGALVDAHSTESDSGSLDAEAEVPGSPDAEPETTALPQDATSDVPPPVCTPIPYGTTAPAYCTPACESSNPNSWCSSGRFESNYAVLDTATCQGTNPSMPLQCRCLETFNCACLAAAGLVTCSDGGAATCNDSTGYPTVVCP